MIFCTSSREATVPWKLKTLTQQRWSDASEAQLPEIGKQHPEFI
jgi:hypothetical protein